MVVAHTYTNPYNADQFVVVVGRSDVDSQRHANSLASKPGFFLLRKDPGLVLAYGTLQNYREVDVFHFENVGNRKKLVGDNLFPIVMYTNAYQASRFLDSLDRSTSATYYDIKLDEHTLSNVPFIDTIDKDKVPIYYALLSEMKSLLNGLEAVTETRDRLDNLPEDTGDRSSIDELYTDTDRREREILYEMELLGHHPANYLTFDLPMIYLYEPFVITAEPMILAFQHSKTLEENLYYMRVIRDSIDSYLKLLRPLLKSQVDFGDIPEAAPIITMAPGSYAVSKMQQSTFRDIYPGPKYVNPAYQFIYNICSDPSGLNRQKLINAIKQGGLQGVIPIGGSDQEICQSLFRYFDILQEQIY